MKVSFSCIFGLNGAWKGGPWPLWQGLLGQCWNVDKTNESSARVIVTFQLPRVHRDQSHGHQGLDQCSVYHKVQDLVTTCSLWCVLSNSMAFHCAKKTLQELRWWCNTSSTAWGRGWSGSRDYIIYLPSYNTM